MKFLKAWLEETAWDKLYWADVKERAFQLGTDGCTGVPDWFVWTCWEHDGHFRTHTTVHGTILTFSEANYIFRVRIQQASMFGALSPMSWMRWFGVTVFGKEAWESFGGYAHCGK